MRKTLLLLAMLSFASFSDATMIILKNMLEDNDVLDIYCQDATMDYGRHKIPNGKSHRFIIQYSRLMDSDSETKKTVRCTAQWGGEAEKRFTLFNPADKKECRWLCFRELRNDAVYLYYPHTKKYDPVVRVFDHGPPRKLPGGGGSTDNGSGTSSPSLNI